jgi:uncharacterized protein (TIGR02118 family)
MVKSIIAIKRRRGSTMDSFIDRWGRLGAPDGARHYVRSERLGEESDGEDAPFDGFASFWFDDEAAARSGIDDFLGASRDLFDPTATRAFTTREIVVRDLAVGPGMVKLVFFFKRRQDLTPEEFRQHWLDVHGPLAMTHIAELRRYVQNHTLDFEYADGHEPAYDGLVEAWMDDVDALRGTEASAAHQLVRSDEPNFLDVRRVSSMAVAEHAVL